MSTFKRGSFKQKALVVAVASCYLGSSHANPTGGTVAAGNATFSTTGNTLTVTNTPGAIINWQQFSIQKDEVTRFIQQNASSAVLNRVTTQNPSVILGTLSSNGRVFLINPSGIAFGQGSIINVAGLAASTLDISDANFSAGRLKFEGTGQEGRLRNSGKITTPEGGHVYLIAPNVRNGKSGVITTPKGEVVIAAGTSVELVNPQTPDLRVLYTAPANTAVNAGQIVAESGRIGVYGTLIKNSGLISATAATVGEGGKIVLKAVKDVNLLAGSRIEANGSRGGDVVVQAETGTLLARGVVEAKGAVEKGGTIHLLGKRVALDGSASVDASGNTGGGKILIGGDVRGANPDVQNADAVYLGADTTVRADAGESGDGGSVVVYSKDSTKIYGGVSARGSSSGAGGSVETSGGYLEIGRAPDVSGGAAGGSWLIDPYNIEIVAGNGTTNNTGTPDFTPNGDSSQIGATLINDQLGAGTNVTVDTGGAGSPGTQAGNLTVNATIQKTGAPNSSSLTLNAANDLTVNALILMNSGDFTANAGGNMGVNNGLVASTMNVNVGGTLAVVGTAAGGPANLQAQGNQTVTAGSLLVSSQGNGAQIVSTSGNQNITVNGGSVDVLAGTHNVAILSLGNQTLTVNNGDHISVTATGAGTQAVINGASGNQAVSITGSGANALNLGGAGSLGAAQINGSTQTITAGLAGQSGSISITGPSASPSPVPSTGIATVSGPVGPGADTQAISTSGTLSITGGTRAAGPNTGIFHNRVGQQAITAANVVLQGGSAGSNNAALISNNAANAAQVVNAGSISLTGGAGGNNNGAFLNTNGAGGTQTINASSISLTGGTVGAGNRASLSTANADQNINGNPTITVIGGANGGVAGNGNNAIISAGGTGRTQTIFAGSLTVTSGAAGTDNSSSVQGNTQTINTLGDVRVSGSGSSGNSSGARIGSGGTLATNLTVNAGGDVVLTGGSGTLAGARLGAAVNATPVDSNVKVTAANVVLNSGSAAGASIGYSVLSTPGGGLLDITATNAIQLNTGANPNGIRTTGNATLKANTITGGANTLVVANGLTTNSAGATSLTGANQVASFNGTTTAGGDLTLNNTGAINLAMAVTGNATVTNAGSVTVTGNATSTGNQTIAVTGGNLDVVAATGIATISSGGNQTLTVTNGDRISIAALGANSGASINAVNGTQDVSITGSGANAFNVGAPGSLGFAQMGARTQSVTAGLTGQSGSITITGPSVTPTPPTAVTGLVTAGPVGPNTDTQTISTSGTLSVTGGTGTGPNTGIFHNRAGQQTITAANVVLQGGSAGNGNNAIISTSAANAAQVVNASGISLTGGAGGNNNGAFLTTNNAGATQTVNASSISLTGGTVGAGNRASLSTNNADQNINGNPTITVTGGANGGVAGNGNNAIISAGGTGRTQTIFAGSLTVTSGAAGTDNSSSVQGNTQVINTVGDVRVSGSGSSGNSSGARIGSGGTLATNLTMNAGGDVVLTGGSGTLAGARLGAAVNATPVDNNVNVTAGGNVLLNAGTGDTATASIGYSSLSTPAGGNINVNAGNSIQMSGTTNLAGIRTTGNVNLNAATISQNSNGRVLANALTTNTSGSTGLGGQNQVASFNGTTTSFGGDLTLNNTGALNLAMAVTGNATLTNAGSVTVTGNATSAGNQTIAVTGGNLDVQSLAGTPALLAATGAGANQTITVTNGDRINVNGATGNAQMFALTGTQAISITGSGANAITVGSSGATGGSNVNALSQTITAGLAGQSGSITIVGPAANSRIAGIVTQSGVGGETQTVSTSGTLSVTGGTAPAQGSNFQSGVFHNRQGAQTVNAANIVLQGGASGSSNGAFVSSLNGGDQFVNVGNVSITGGTGVAGNRAGISALNASQTINAAAITITGGATGGVAGSGNTAFVQSTGTGKLQTINANSIDVTSGAGGTDNNASITGTTQVIGTTGNVTLSGSGSAGTAGGSRIGGLTGLATNLTLNAGGDVVITGGSAAPLGGARIGAAVSATPLDSNVTVNAGGSVILNGGTGAGAAIGYSQQSVPGGGTIAVTAGNSIQLNGNSTSAVIRTTGNVALNAPTISQSATGAVLANGLTTSTSGSTGLGGQNQVASFNGTTTGGDLTLNNAGALNLAMNVNGAATVTNAGSVTVSSNAISTGNQTISVTGGNLDVQNLGGGSVQLGATGFGANQTLTVTNGDRISVNGAAGGVLVSALTGTQTISITGSGANAINVGSAGALGQSFVGARNQAITAGNAGESGSITIVGSAATNALAGFVSQQGPGQTQSVSTTGALTVTGGTAASQAAGFNAGVFHNGTGQQTVNAGSISVTGGASGNNNGAFVASQFGGTQALTAGNIAVTGGTVGNGNRAGIFVTNADQTITGAAITVTGGASGGIAGNSNTANIGVNNGTNGTARTQTINAGSITVNGGAGGTDNSATITGNTQSLTVAGDLRVNGGNSGGNLTGARIGGQGTASPTSTNLTVNAGGDVVLTGGSQPLAGARLGSTVSATPLDSNVTVNAGGSVILNEGPAVGAAIGYSTLSTPGGGTINVNATNSIQLNGAVNATSIRTTGNVNLNAATISSGSNGRVLANNLTTHTSGSTGLGGTNQVASFNGTTTAGDLTLNNTGALNLAMGVNGSATVTNAGSVTVSSNATSTGNQAINVTGGNLDVQNLTGGQISLSATGAGANQTLSVTNGDRISFNGAAGGVFVSANGTQTISVTGSGANAINVGSAGALGQSYVTGRNQAITAGNAGEAGSITIVGTAATNTLAGFVSQQGPGQTQSVSTSGALTITGGNAASQAVGFATGVFHNGTGQQTVNAGSIAVTGGASGNNNGAFIASQFGGAQSINVAGNLGVTGGSGGTNNRASVSSNGSQTINAGSISVTAGSGGTDNSATIVGVSQLINSVTNVFVTGGSTTGTLNGARIGGLGGAGGPTNLVLGAGGDVVITGGSAALSGARLGSTVSASALDNNITVNAGGSVILNEGGGAGAAIGYSVLSVPAGGTISVTAGNDIQLNGTAQATAIRTTGNVDLHAGGAITEGTNGFILANGLTTTSGGNTTLTGPNQVSSFNGTSSAGDVSLSNIGGLNLTGLSAAGSATLAAEAVNGAGDVSTGTGFSVTVASDSLLSGVISGAGGLTKQGGGTLTVSGNDTYAGETNVLAGTLAIGGTDRTNSGVVNVASGATYRGSAGSFTNAGVIGGNGTVDVTGTSFTNTGTLRPGGSGAIGTLTVAGNATLGSTSVVDIEAQSAASHDVLAVTGAAALGGNLNVTPINGYVPANGDTLTPLTYASRTGTVFVPGSWLPTYNPANLQLGFDSTMNRWVGTTGNWNVDANWSLGHTPLASETVLVDVLGNQLVTVSNGSRFAGKLVSFEDFLVSGGSLSLGGPSAFNGALSLTGGTLQGAGSITANGLFTWTGGTLAGSGQFLTAPGSIVTLSPTTSSLHLERNWRNEGFVTWQAANGRDLVIADGATLVNALGGVVTLAAAQGSNIKGDGAFRNEGTLNKEGTDRTTIKAFFTNGPTGTLNVDSGTLRLKRSVSNEGAIGIAAGATLEVKGGDYVNNGRVTGSGTLDVGGHRLNNLGVLAPGAANGTAVGTFTVQGDYYQAPSGVLEMGLGGVAAGQYDVLAVTGKASLGGTMVTNAVNGYVPTAGDSFKLLTYKSRSGQFATLQAPAPLELSADYEKRFGLFTLE